MDQNLSEFKYEGTEILENLKEARNYNEALVRLVTKYRKDGRSLDFGAGIGTFAEECREYFPLECLELDPEHISELESKSFKVIKKLSQADGKFNYIYSLNVFEHIEDDKQVANELIESLAPGARAFICVPAFQILFSNLDRRVGHFRRYTRNSLLETFNHSAVEVVCAKYFDSIGFLFALVFKLLGLDTQSINTRNVIIFDRFFFPLNNITDFLFNRFFGKNVYLVIEKKTSN